MTLRHLIFREVQRSKINTLLCLATVLVATGLLMAMFTVSRASVDATRKMMKDMGFNLLITHEDADPARYESLDFEGPDMPASYIDKLVESSVLAQHFVGKYQRAIQIDGFIAVLTGVLPEATLHGTVKKPMPTAYEVPDDKVYVGQHAASRLGLSQGDTVNILGKDFEVAGVIDEQGTPPDNIRIFAQLDEVQALLGVEGRINAIDALACYCPEQVDDVLAALKDSIHRVLPDVNVKAYRSILLARQEQREMLYRLEQVAIAIVMIGSAAAIWVLTYVNVRNRRREVGVLRALGFPDKRIYALFVGKTLGYALVGAILGIALGYYAADAFNPAAAKVTFSTVMALAVLVVTPVVAVLFAIGPIVNGLLQDPTELLKEENA